eukprot:5991380-Pleurochrysis_carterae.AAC.1
MARIGSCIPASVAGAVSALAAAPTNSCLEHRHDKNDNAKLSFARDTGGGMDYTVGGDTGSTRGGFGRFKTSKR